MMFEKSMGGFDRDFPVQLRACLTKHSTVHWDNTARQYHQDPSATELYKKLTSHGTLSAFIPRIPTRHHLVSESFVQDTECYAPAVLNSIPFRHVIWIYDSHTSQEQPLPNLLN